MDQKFLMIIITLGALTIIGLVLGLVLGLKIKDDEDSEVLNSYDNTDELKQKYKTIYDTTVNEGIEKRIQNRLLTGFENWNRGFKAWKEWGNILYTPKSIYNVHGARLTLEHYQQAMDIALKQADIIMGDFYNMLIVNNFCAIHYDFKTNGRSSHVMEFVEFKDYGNGISDTRVVEGWGSTKDSTYYGTISFQGSEEKKEQEELNNLLLIYQIPTTYADLKEKYPVKYTPDESDTIWKLFLQ